MNKEVEVLRDIRGLEEIPDISLYLFIGLVAVGLLVILGLIMMLYRYKKSKGENLTRKEVLRRLEEIELSAPKQAAYKITKYARYLADDTRSQKIFEGLEQRLERYKYMPNPPAFDEDTIGQYHLFLEVVHV